MYLLGYSLNNLSLMALTLSVGFVVDDAIVMLENIVRHMEMGESRMEAALAASREIGFTILSMTFSLVAVFIPVLFMGGHRGPAAARILGDHRGGDPDFRLRLAEPDADAGQPLPANRARGAPRPRSTARWKAASTCLARWYERTLADRAALPAGHAGGRGADAGGHRLPVQHHAHRLHPQPGQRFLVRRHPGPAGHFVRIHGQPRTRASPRSCAPTPTSRTWARSSWAAIRRSSSPI